MLNTSPALLSDRELLDETARVVDRARQTTAELLALLAEVDARRLYLGEGYSSLFTYCTQALHLSEPAAYGRITAARAARRFPIILSLMADGVVTLTTISLLAAHLTDENHEALLDAARHQSKRDVERLVACLTPQPDIPASVRKLAAARPASRREARFTHGSGTCPEPRTERRQDLLPVADEARRSGQTIPAAEGRSGIDPDATPIHPEATPPAPVRGPSHRVVAPLTAERYLLKVTITAETHVRLARARDLLRHQIPDGDLAAIVDRALIVLLERLEKTKLAATHLRRPCGSGPRKPRGRHVPAAVKRAVWARDEGRCTFVGGDGRCRETGFLEFHHAVPFAGGGATSTDNLQLSCRAHNAYDATREFGDWRLRCPTPSGLTS